MVSIVPTVQRHLDTGPKTVAQQKMAGERAQLTQEINAFILKHTGRKDLFIHDSKTMTLINLVKMRDVLAAMDQKF